MRAMRPRVDLATRLRLASGLVLMAFVASHLVNHALGIVSLEAMERGRDVFLAVWRSPLGTLLLFGALLGHVLLSSTGGAASGWCPGRSPKSCSAC
jgi:hypothetical protein